MLELTMVKPTFVIEGDALVTQEMSGKFSLSNVLRVNVALESSSWVCCSLALSQAPPIAAGSAASVSLPTHTVIERMGNTVVRRGREGQAPPD